MTYYKACFIMADQINLDFSENVIHVLTLGTDEENTN